MKFFLLFIFTVLISSCHESKDESNINARYEDYIDHKIDRNEIQSIELMSHANFPESVVIPILNTGEAEEAFMVPVINRILEWNRNSRFKRPIDIQVAIANFGTRSGKERMKKYKSLFSEDDHKYITFSLNKNSFFHQDTFETVYATTNNNSNPLRMLMLNRGIHDTDGQLLKKYDMKFFDHEYETGSENGFGTLEATPNGIAMVGSTTGEKYRSFIRNNGYGENLVTIDTEFLDVGHVDEIITTVIRPETDCGFSLLQASPQLALTTFLDTPRSQLEITNSNYRYVNQEVLKIWRDIYNSSSFEEIDWNQYMGIESIIKSQTYQEYYKDRKNKFKRMVEIEKRILESVSLLKEKIRSKTPSCQNIEVTKIPVWFNCVEMDTGRTVCNTSLPNSINMMVIGRDLFVPSTLLPSFDSLIKKSLNKIGQRIQFVDSNNLNWTGGNVHCITNALRSKDKFEDMLQAGEEL